MMEVGIKALELVLPEKQGEDALVRHRRRLVELGILAVVGGAFQLGGPVGSLGERGESGPDRVRGAGQNSSF